MTLEQAEVAKQGGDLAGRVFIDGMKPNQGIENEENGTMKHKRGLEPLLVGHAVQTQRVGGDDPNVQVRQREPVVAASDSKRKR